MDAEDADAGSRKPPPRSCETERTPRRSPRGPHTRRGIRRVVGPRSLRSNLVLRCPHDRTKEGLTIAELAARRGVDPWTAYFDVIVEEQDRAVGLFDYMDLEEIKSTLRHPLVMICSDGWVAPKEERTSATAPYQPCTFGEFPGVLQRFVVEEPVLTLPNAIYKMSGMPAKRLALKDRGLIREGFA